MSYKGDAHLAKLLKAAGETRPLDEIKSVLKGIIAAPEDIAAPGLWLSLFKTDKNAAEQLTALKNELAAEKPAPQQDKLAALRDEMKKRNIEGFYIPRADEFHGEYVPARSERLAWATGFTGSAGVAVVLKDKAGFFTDGRYTLAARKQVDKKDFDICSTSDDQDPTPTMSPVEWIEKNLQKGQTFGIDPWIMSANEVKAVKGAVDKAGGRRVPAASTPALHLVRSPGSPNWRREGSIDAHPQRAEAWFLS